MKNEEIPKEEIETRAYELYLECGCDGGHDLEHWLAAEAQLRQERAKEPAPLKSTTAVAGLRGGRSSSDG